MPFRTVALAWRDQTSASPCIDSTSIPLKRAFGNSCKISITIPRSDQKLWPFQIVTSVWRDQTVASPSTDSRSTPWKMASINSYKSLIEIQRSNQKLWSFQTVTLAWCDQTSSSLSIASTSTLRKGPPETPIKFWSQSNGRIKSYGPFEPLFWHGSTRPPPHRV